MATVVVNLRDEPYDIYIGRGSPWGNPFKIGRDGSRGDVIQQFRVWVKRKPWLIEKAKKELKGKRLGCFCKPLPCHGDVWVELIGE